MSGQGAGGYGGSQGMPQGSGMPQGMQRFGNPGYGLGGGYQRPPSFGMGPQGMPQQGNPFMQGGRALSAPNGDGGYTNGPSSLMGRMGGGQPFHGGYPMGGDGGFAGGNMAGRMGIPQGEQSMGAMRPPAFSSGMPPQDSFKPMQIQDGSQLPQPGQDMQSFATQQPQPLPSYDGINDPDKRAATMQTASQFFQGQGPQGYAQNYRKWLDGAPTQGGGIANGSMAPMGLNQQQSGDSWQGDHWASQGARPTGPMAPGQAGWQYDVNGKQWVPQFPQRY